MQNLPPNVPMSAEKASRRLLLVEDDDAQAMLCRIAIEEGCMPCHIDRVRDGEEAMQFLRRAAAAKDSRLPDVVILDLKLPRVNGHEVLQAIKSDPRLKCVPVVIFTSSDAESDRNLAYNLHANSFLTKPFDFTEFNETLKAITDYWTCRNVSAAS